MIELLIAGIMTYAGVGCYLAGKRLFGGLGTPTVKEPEETIVDLGIDVPSCYKFKCLFMHYCELYYICIEGKGRCFTYAGSKEQVREVALEVFQNGIERYGKKVDR